MSESKQDYRIESVYQLIGDPSSLPPSSTTAPVLESIKLLADMEKRLKDADFKNSNLGKFAEENVAIFNASLNAIQNDQRVRDQFGSSFESVQALGGVLKNMLAQERGRSILLPHLPQTTNKYDARSAYKVEDGVMKRV